MTNILVTCCLDCPFSEQPPGISNMNIKEYLCNAWSDEHVIGHLPKNKGYPRDCPLLEDFASVGLDKWYGHTFLQVAAICLLDTSDSVLGVDNYILGENARVSSLELNFHPKKKLTIRQDCSAVTLDVDTYSYEIDTKSQFEMLLTINCYTGQFIFAIDINDIEDLRAFLESPQWS